MATETKVASSQSDELIVTKTVNPVELPGGIPGLSDSPNWQIEGLGDDDDSTFMLLSCADEPDTGLIVTIPWLFFPDYAPDVPEVDYDELDLKTPEDAVVFCPVTLDAENDMIYVNLLGPFVVNSTTGKGRQVVLMNSEYPVRAPVQLTK